MLQLPPKRRQIIKLILKKSDIKSAMVKLELEDIDATADSDTENVPLHVSDKDQGIIWHLLNAYVMVRTTGFSVCRRCT